MDCPRCEATGVCQECKGTGQTVCPACQGKGARTTPKGTTFDCKTCGGTGKTDCSPKCASCAGTGQLTDRLRREVRDKYVVQFDNTTPDRHITTILLTLNLTIFVCQQMHVGPIQPFVSHYGYNTASGWTSGQIWRLLTPMFLHSGIMHILMNSWVMFRECPILEGYYGSKRFLACYLLAGTGANLLSWLGNCCLDGMPVAGIGASGSLFGVGGALIALHYRWGLFERRQIQTYAGYLVLYLLGGFSMAVGYLDNWGHLGGFITGFLFVWLSRRPTGR